MLDAPDDLSSRLATGAVSAGCPDDAQLEKLLLGLLSDEQLAAIEGHVAFCPRCEAALAGATGATDSLLDALRRHPRRCESLEACCAEVDALAPRLREWGAVRRSSSERGALLDEFAGTPRFRIVRRLGAGGMGVVYEAHDTLRDELVALKTFRRASVTAPTRLTREFRALADLVHPNLVSLYELHAEGERRFFTMERIEGRDFISYVRGDALLHEAPTVPQHPSTVLHDRSVHSRPPPDFSRSLPEDGYGRAQPLDEPPQFERLRRALAQLVDGLDVLHAAGKLHRDVKPSNVLVTADGRLVLLDFGLATELDSDELLRGGLAGTVAYLSPEQAQGAVPTPASDWYSVGVMLYQALCGRLPFAGASDEVLWRKQRERPPELATTAEAGELATLCRDLLAIEPERRPNADEIRRCLASGTKTWRRARQPLASPTGPHAYPDCFVGRDGELTALADAFSVAEHGEAIVLSILGPSGVGKTALARHFLDRLAEHDAALVLEGRCHERELLPYKAAEALIEALVSHLEHEPRRQVEDWLPADIAAAAGVFAALRRLPGLSTSPLPEVVGGQAELRRAAFMALRELLQAVSHERPIVMLVDDLQWGDTDSIPLFAEWLRRPNPPRLLLLVCHRDEQQKQGSAPRALSEAQLVGGWSQRALRLDPLAADDARELARRWLPTTLSDAARDAAAAGIASDSAGHPYFVRELADCGGRADLTPSIAGSANTLEDLICRRAGELPHASRRLLEVIAVAGYPLSELRAYAAARLALSDHSPLMLLRASRLVRTTGAELPGKLECYHDRIRAAVASRLPAETVRAWHRRLAEVIHESEAAGADSESLVWHYQQAGEHETAASFAVTSGDRAATVLAFDQAATCYRLALDGRSWRAAEEEQLRVRLGDALAKAGRGGEAAGEWLRAAELSGTSDALRLRQRAGEQLLSAGRVEEALLVLEPVFLSLRVKLPPKFAPWSWAPYLIRMASVRWRSLHRKFDLQRRPSGDELRRIDLSMLVGGMLSYFETLRAGELVLRGSQLALRSGNSVRIALTLCQQAAMAAHISRRGQRIAARLLDRAKQLPITEEESQFAEGFALGCRGICRMPAGEWSMARQMLADCEEAVKNVADARFVMLRSQRDFYLQWAMYYLGDLGALAAHVYSKLPDAARRGDVFLAGTLRSSHASAVWLAADRPDEARRHLAEATGSGRGVGFTVQHYSSLLSAVQIDLYCGRGLDAWRRVEAAWRPLRRSGMLLVCLFGLEAQDLRARAALAAALIADARTARRLRKTAMQSARRLRRQAAPWAAALAQAIEASISAANGDTARACKGYERAVELFTQCEMSLHAAAARRRWGELLGGAEGARLVAEADRWMEENTIREPSRMTAMLCPV